MATADYNRMLEAANEWGPEMDPERRWFLAGWIDERDNDKAEASHPPGNFETNVAAWAAYNSGRVANREQGL